VFARLDPEAFEASFQQWVNEDASRIGKDHAPRNFSVLRRFALNLLRQDSSKGSLAMKRYKAGLNDQFMVQILAPLLSSDEA
jgi:hypothetical protein